jgi:hypothetical protein
MARPKFYTLQETPKNKMIQAAVKKGLTNIKITWNPAMNSSRGYVLECDQIKWLRIYGNARTVAQKISNWEIKDGKIKY